MISVCHQNVACVLCSLHDFCFSFVTSDWFVFQNYGEYSRSDAPTASPIPAYPRTSDIPVVPTGALPSAGIPAFPFYRVPLPGFSMGSRIPAVRFGPGFRPPIPFGFRPPPPGMFGPPRGLPRPFPPYVPPIGGPSPPWAAAPPGPKPTVAPPPPPEQCYPDVTDEMIEVMNVRLLFLSNIQ